MTSRENHVRSHVQEMNSCLAAERTLVSFEMSSAEHTCETKPFHSEKFTSVHDGSENQKRFVDGDRCK